MKKYSKPIVKACKISMSSIIAGSKFGINEDNTNATQLSNERGGFFDEEEAPAW